MQKQTLLFALIDTITTFLVVAYTTLQSLLPGAPTLSAALIVDLDKYLAAYESTTIAADASPDLALALQAIQTARHRLIRDLLDCLASEYPEIDLTPYLDRFTEATVLEPLIE